MGVFSCFAVSPTKSNSPIKRPSPIQKGGKASIRYQNTPGKLGEGTRPLYNLYYDAQPDSPSYDETETVRMGGSSISSCGSTNIPFKSHQNGMPWTQVTELAEEVAVLKRRLHEEEEEARRLREKVLNLQPITETQKGDGHSAQSSANVDDNHYQEDLETAETSDNAENVEEVEHLEEMENAENQEDGDDDAVHVTPTGHLSMVSLTTELGDGLFGLKSTDGVVVEVSTSRDVDQVRESIHRGTEVPSNMTEKAMPKPFQETTPTSPPQSDVPSASFQGSNLDYLSCENESPDEVQEGTVDSASWIGEALNGENDEREEEREGKEERGGGEAEGDGENEEKEGTLAFPTEVTLTLPTHSMVTESPVAVDSTSSTREDLNGENEEGNVEEEEGKGGGGGGEDEGDGENKEKKGLPLAFPTELTLTPPAHSPGVESPMATPDSVTQKTPQSSANPNSEGGGKERESLHIEESGTLSPRGGRFLWFGRGTSAETLPVSPSAHEKRRGDDGGGEGGGENHEEGPLTFPTELTQTPPSHSPVGESPMATPDSVTQKTPQSSVFPISDEGGKGVQDPFLEASGTLSPRGSRFSWFGRGKSAKTPPVSPPSAQEKVKRVEKKTEKVEKAEKKKEAAKKEKDEKVEKVEKKARKGQKGETKDLKLVDPHKKGEKVEKVEKGGKKGVTIEKMEKKGEKVKKAKIKSAKIEKLETTITKADAEAKVEKVEEKVATAEKAENETARVENVEIEAEKDERAEKKAEKVEMVEKGEKSESVEKVERSEEENNVGRRGEEGDKKETEGNPQISVKFLSGEDIRLSEHETPPNAEGDERGQHAELVKGTNLKKEEEKSQIADSNVAGLQAMVSKPEVVHEDVEGFSFACHTEPAFQVGEQLDAAEEDESEDASQMDLQGKARFGFFSRALHLGRSGKRHTSMKCASTDNTQVAKQQEKDITQYEGEVTLQRKERRNSEEDTVSEYSFQISDTWVQESVAVQQKSVVSSEEQTQASSESFMFKNPEQQFSETSDPSSMSPVYRHPLERRPLGVHSDLNIEANVENSAYNIEVNMEKEKKKKVGRSKENRGGGIGGSQHHFSFNNTADSISSISSLRSGKGRRNSRSGWSETSESQRSHESIEMESGEGSETIVPPKSEVPKSVMTTFEALLELGSETTVKASPWKAMQETLITPQEGERTEETEEKETTLTIGANQDDFQLEKSEKSEKFNPKIGHDFSAEQQAVKRGSEVKDETQPIDFLEQLKHVMNGQTGEVTRRRMHWNTGNEEMFSKPLQTKTNSSSGPSIVALALTPKASFKRAAKRESFSGPLPSTGFGFSTDSHITSAAINNNGGGNGAEHQLYYTKARSGASNEARNLPIDYQNQSFKHENSRSSAVDPQLQGLMYAPHHAFGYGGPHIASLDGREGGGNSAFWGNQGWENQAMHAGVVPTGGKKSPRAWNPGEEKHEVKNKQKTTPPQAHPQHRNLFNGGDKKPQGRATWSPSSPKIEEGFFSGTGLGVGQLMRTPTLISPRSLRKSPMKEASTSPATEQQNVANLREGAMDSRLAGNMWKEGFSQQDHWMHHHHQAVLVPQKSSSPQQAPKAASRSPQKSTLQRSRSGGSFDVPRSYNVPIDTRFTGSPVNNRKGSVGS